MKNARQEIAESIRKRKLICFEAVPMNFEEDGHAKKSKRSPKCEDQGVELENLSNWSVIAE